MIFGWGEVGGWFIDRGDKEFDNRVRQTSEGREELEGEAISRKGEINYGNVRNSRSHRSNLHLHGVRGGLSGFECVGFTGFAVISNSKEKGLTDSQ